MRPLLTLTVAIFISLNALASHVAGGQITLQHLEENSYLLTLKKFGDCANGHVSFTEPLYIGMFSASRLWPK